jgi:NAD+ synthase
MLTKDALAIDPAFETERIARALRAQVQGTLRRKGVVVGLSGGVDSSVVAALAVQAFGGEKVFGLLMPERDSSSDALTLGRLVADRFGIPTIIEDIAPALAALGCYSRQVDAIHAVFPEYGDGWKCKITLQSIIEHDRLNVSYLTVRPPDGEERTARMPAGAYRALVAATNFKQRVRKMLEYYHADRLHFAVAGTPNRLEYDQGFFVKQGDGAADVKPIAHLFKTQVYALAAHLGVPADVTSRPPTTDTYSLPQTQEEFYFAVDYRRMDLCLYAHDHGIPASEVSGVIDLAPEQVERIYRDIEAKRRATRYLHERPLLVDEAGS